jgi:multidrug resistance protein MdtO
MMRFATSHRDHEPSLLRSCRDFLREELAPFPGRANFMVRMLIANLLVIVIGMALQVPMTILAVISVISTIQSNMVLTRLIGVLTLVALVMAIGTTLVLVKFTYDYPLLRITAASLIYLGCMYLMRAMKLGIIFSGVGLVVMYAQSMIDSPMPPEFITREILWAMVATGYGTIVALIVNSCVLPRAPAKQMADEAHAQLTEASARLTACANGRAQDIAQPSMRTLRLGFDKLQKLAQFASMNAPHDEAAKLYRQSWIGVVSRVRFGANALSPDIACHVPAPLLQHLVRQIDALDAAIAAQAPYRVDCTLEQRAALERHPDTGALLRALDAFAQFTASEGAQAQVPAQAAAAEAMWLPDARTNPHYVQFALKALIASLIAYVIYTATQWEGIHTIMVSVSLLVYPTLGMSLQRMPLRLAGAMLGALLAIVLTVTVMPHLDSIVGLLLMLTPVFLVGGWIGGGTERTGYIGVQMIGTCCLPLVEGFGPSYDLTEVRDRAVGIVLGILISAVVFSCLWPESERGVLRQRLAALLRQTSRLIRAQQQQLSAVERQKALIEAWTTLNECEAMYERIVYERDFQRGPKIALANHARALLDRARQILVAQDDLHNALAATPQLSPECSAVVGQSLDQTSDALDAYAEAVERDAGVQPVSVPRPLAALEAAFDRQNLPQQEKEVLLARLRVLLDGVAGLPDSQPEPHAPLPRIEGPAQ